MARFVVCTVVAVLASLDMVLSQTLGYDTYARVVEIDTCSSVLHFDGNHHYDEGDLILIHQTQVHNNESSGVVGRFTMARVVGKESNTVAVDNSSLGGFDVRGVVQACTVIGGGKGSVTVDSITSASFSFDRGGIIAIVADTIHMWKGAFAVGCGFAGGTMSRAGFDTNQVDTLITHASTLCGAFGEYWLNNPEFYSGSVSDHCGGGGGNARNAGGGGGAHGGQGGKGGDQTNEFQRLSSGGHGGVVLGSSSLIFGGGGGGGHQNDFLGSDGGAGGGIVFIKCNLLVAHDTCTIDASGAAAGPAFGDGAGGGGAGGSVVFEAREVVGTVRLVAAGGRGGHVSSSVRCYGPGGGGGGGRIFTNTTAATNVAGGAAGITSTNIGCTDLHYGAQSGFAGETSGLISPHNGAVEPCARPQIIVRGIDTSAYPGEQIGIPIEIEALEYLQRSVAVEMKVQTRVSVLVPLGSFWWAGRHETSRYTRTTVLPGPPRKELFHLPYGVALGDSAEVIVKIDSAWSDDAQVSVVYNGRFTTLGVCNTQERIRLFNSWAEQQPGEVFNVLGQHLTGASITGQRQYFLRSNGRYLPKSMRIVPR